MWILLVLVVQYHGSSQHTAEFNTKEACVAAANEWSKRANSIGYIDAVRVLCTPKG